MVPANVSRRRFLQAGGITFLALLPTGRGTFAFAAAPGGGKTALPLFTAIPYIQPGPHGGGAVSGSAEAMTLAWQTNAVPAEYTVSCTPHDRGKGDGVSGAVQRTQRFSGDPEDGEGVYNYAAHLTGLLPGTRYDYTVHMNGKTLAEGYFTTRKPRGSKCRFVAFGDNSFGEISDRMIAYQAYRANPEFVMNTGDNVYENGLDNEYARYFFPVYNADEAGPRLGAPLLRSVPFYTVIANHDVHDKDANKHPVADFTKNPDSLAYYTAMHLPLNGLSAPPRPTPAIGDEKRIGVFRAAAGERFPRMANYSFDYADAHFLCLDSNIYVDPTDAALQSWIEADLRDAADAPWKFVVYHHPAFNVGDEHYSEQHMRVLCPLFERMGVTLVLNGHEHTYQRTMPFTFAPSDLSGAKNVGEKKRLVPGTFTLDQQFDGKNQTRAKGIVHLTTGAGGKHLYDPQMNENPERWRHPEDNNVVYITRFVSDRHSLTVFEMDAQSLLLRQIDQWGNEIDRCRWTK